MDVWTSGNNCRVDTLFKSYHTKFEIDSTLNYNMSN